MSKKFSQYHLCPRASPLFRSPATIYFDQLEPPPPIFLAAADQAKYNFACNHCQLIC